MSEEGWRALAVEYGYCPTWDKSDLDYGHVEALDAAGAVMPGVVSSVGGGSQGCGLRPKLSEHFESFETAYPARPSAIRWTYVDEAEEYRIPVLFTDCRLPDTFWNRPEEEEEAQSGKGE